MNVFLYPVWVWARQQMDTSELWWRRRGSRKIAISREVKGILQICLRILAESAGVDVFDAVSGLNHTYLMVFHAIQNLTGFSQKSRIIDLFTHFSYIVLDAHGSQDHNMWVNSSGWVDTIHNWLYLTEIGLKIIERERIVLLYVPHKRESWLNHYPYVYPNYPNTNWYFALTSSVMPRESYFLPHITLVWLQVKIPID